MSENQFFTEYAAERESIGETDGSPGAGGIVFESVRSLEQVLVADGVTEIPWAAYKDCAGLKSVSLPESVAEIGSGAFEGCVSLTDVTVPKKVSALEPRVFRNCESLVSIILPEGLVSIGREAFNGCKKLKSVSIPGGVARMEPAAFRDCSSLETVVFQGTPQEIGEGSFLGCAGLSMLDCTAEGLRRFFLSFPLKEKAGILYRYIAGSLRCTTEADGEILRMIRGSFRRLAELAAENDDPGAASALLSICKEPEAAEELARLSDRHHALKIRAMLLERGNADLRKSPADELFLD